MFIGVSVGNIYRYYRNKDEISCSVVPEDFPPQILSIIQHKIGAAGIDRDANSRIFEAVTDAFVRFMLSNRKKILVVLAGSGGTKYADYRNELIAGLISAIRKVYPEKYDAYIRNFGNSDMLQLIYDNLIRAYGTILGLHCSEEEMINLIRQIRLYHYSGIVKLLNI